MVGEVDDEEVTRAREEEGKEEGGKREREREKHRNNSVKRDRRNV